MSFNSGIGDGTLASRLKATPFVNEEYTVKVIDEASQWPMIGFYQKNTERWVFACRLATLYTCCGICHISSFTRNWDKPLTPFLDYIELICKESQYGVIVAGTNQKQDWINKHFRDREYAEMKFKSPRTRNICFHYSKDITQ